MTNDEEELLNISPGKARLSKTGLAHLSLPHDCLAPGIPVPEQDGAVLAAGHDVAVAGVVALRPGQAGHHPPVTEDDLSDLGRLRREDTEAVVPEAGSDNKSAVHGGHEGVGSHLDLLGEVVSEVSPGLLPGGVGHHRQDGVHGERQVDTAGGVVSIARRLGRGWTWRQVRILTLYIH